MAESFSLSQEGVEPGKKNLLKIASIFKPELTPVTSGTFDLNELVALLSKDG